MEPIFDLAIQLPQKGSRDLLRSLHRHLRDAIIDGRLQSGVRLPPTRELAAALGISRNTAVAAYDLLMSESYVETRQGAGTYVANLRSRMPATVARRSEPEHRPDARLNAFWRDRRAPDVGPSNLDLRYDFQLGVPDLALVPFSIWQRLSARALRALSRQPRVEAEAHGRPELRAAIAQHVSFTRAVACRSDDVTVTSGAQQAFDLLARILVAPGKTVVALEDPGYPPMRAAFSAVGARLALIPVDEEGLLVSRLPKETRVVCVTPSHQFPLGMAMSLRRRDELLAFANARNAVVIEDDYDAEFRFGGRALDALQTLDSAGSVIYVGTFSKSLFPALRLGYVVSPPWAHGALAAARRIATGECAVLAQDTLAAFIAGGHLARHVRKMRRIYAARRQVMEDKFANDLGEWLEPIHGHAGLHLAAFVRGRLNADSIAQRARQAGIGIYPLSRFYAGSVTRQGLVFGYGNISGHEIADGLEQLARLLRRGK